MQEFGADKTPSCTGGGVRRSSVNSPRDFLRALFLTVGMRSAESSKGEYSVSANFCFALGDGLAVLLIDHAFSGAW